ncbi:hypothetical protein [Nitratiruptor sp. SB155-2]|uniref:hypothetical protein n=1 Tax=Nitratiruptor sp. (strain SB155-2) TaxID=387092 RepID=UPI00015872D1|nr:hypothetical protein [Nitratiruptor sp. SB155-2]BAF70431.1 hypothetical protein NIS_1323 [Nitratiruptor sp. SB155-2]
MSSHLPPPIDLTRHSRAGVRNITPQQNYSSIENETPQEELQRYWNSLIHIRELDNKKLKEVIDQIMPYELAVACKEEDKKAFLNVVRYDPYHDSIAVKWMDDEGKQIRTIKHRKKRGFEGKWIAYKGTRANANAQIRIKDPLEPVFILEGFHDYLTALLVGINFIVVPFKGYRQLTPKEMDHLRQKMHPKHKYDFVFIPDIDGIDERTHEKKIAKEAIISLMKQLEPLAYLIDIWDIHEKYEYTRGHEKVDFSDIFSLAPIEIFKDLEGNLQPYTHIVGEHYFF